VNEASPTGWPTRSTHPGGDAGRLGTLSAVPSPSGDRAAHFPAIERKHGKPVAFWLRELADLGEATYPEQMALLQERHGFSRTHANALVMVHRGSPSSRRHATPAAYFASLPPDQRRTAKAVFAAIRAKHPSLELVVAWNQPMLRTDRGYVFGLGAASAHLLINPFSTDVLEAVRPRLGPLEVKKHTIRIPVGWKVDAALLNAMVRLRLAELRA
jgi:uncharacterized protein YdhG (YjbR/CyaY superfamily)